LCGATGVIHDLPGKGERCVRSSGLRPISKTNKRKLKSKFARVNNWHTHETLAIGISL
jgi:hypothetical protein